MSRTIRQRKPETLSCFPRATEGPGDSWHMQPGEPLSYFLLRVQGGCRTVAVGQGPRAGVWPEPVCACVCGVLAGSLARSVSFRAFYLERSNLPTDAGTTAVKIDQVCCCLWKLGQGGNT